MLQESTHANHYEISPSTAEKAGGVVLTQVLDNGPDRPKPNFRTGNSIYGHHELRDYDENLEKVFSGNMAPEEHEAETDKALHQMREELEFFAKVPQLDDGISAYFDRNGGMTPILRSKK